MRGAWCQSWVAQQADQPDSQLASLSSFEGFARRLSSALGANLFGGHRTMPNCFIIMPLTTPDTYVNLYGNDKDHFIHVLDHLFKPAITKIEYTPIPPIAEGSDLIHAGIIKQLETADLVLCDISTLNAN